MEYFIEIRAICDLLRDEYGYSNKQIQDLIRNTDAENKQEYSKNGVLPKTGGSPAAALPWLVASGAITAADAAAKGAAAGTTIVIVGGTVLVVTAAGATIWFAVTYPSTMPGYEEKYGVLAPGQRTGGSLSGTEVGRGGSGNSLPNLDDIGNWILAVGAAGFFSLTDIRSNVITGDIPESCRYGVIEIADLGIGPTGRIIPRNLEEQLAMAAAKANPWLSGAIVKQINIAVYKDIRFVGNWLKHTAYFPLSGIEIHFMYNPDICKATDFKFKD